MCKEIIGPQEGATYRPTSLAWAAGSDIFLQSVEKRGKVGWQWRSVTSSTLARESKTNNQSDKSRDSASSVEDAASSLPGRHTLSLWRKVTQSLPRLQCRGTETDPARRAPPRSRGGRLGREQLVAVNPRRELGGGGTPHLSYYLFADRGFASLCFLKFPSGHSTRHPPHHRSWLETRPRHERHKVPGGHALWRPRLTARLITCQAWVSGWPQDLRLACPSLLPL